MDILFITHLPGLTATVMILNFLTDRFWQTVHIQIRLLLEEQSDQQSGSSLFAIPSASLGDISLL